MVDDMFKIKINIDRHSPRLIQSSTFSHVGTEMPQRQVAHGHMGCSAMHNLGTNFLVA